MTGRADFARVARDTLDYVRARDDRARGRLLLGDRRRLRRGRGVEEGTFFTWTEAEIEQLLGRAPTPPASSRFYGVTAGGELRGAQRPRTSRAPTSDESGARWPPPAAALLARRARRPPPLRDEKILAAWNGLMISAFAAPAACSTSRATSRRPRAPPAFVLDRMRPDGRLQRSWKDGRAGARLPRRLRLPDRRSARSLRGDLRAPLARGGDRARRRDRAPLRRSGRAAGS